MNLRDSFETGEEVLVHKRQYRDAPAAIVLGKIVRKEATVVSVRFVRGTSVSYATVAYGKLQKVPPIREREEVARRATPQARATHPPTAEPRSRTQRFQPSTEVHVAEVIQRRPYPAASAGNGMPSWKAQDGSLLRAVPPALANLATTLSKSEPPPAPAPVAPAPAPAPVPASTALAAPSDSANVVAWLEMGQVLVAELHRKLAGIAADVAALRKQAFELEEQADRRAREADDLRLKLTALEAFRHEAEDTAKQVLLDDPTAL